MLKHMVEEIETLIEKTLNSDVKAAEKYLRVLILKLEELEGNQEFLGSLKEEIKNLLEDFRHTKGLLREDWLRITKSDLRKLKARLAYLQELLRSGAVRTKGIDPRRLLREIYEEGGMSEATWMMILNHPSLERPSKKEKEILLRLSCLLNELRKVKNDRNPN